MQKKKKSQSKKNEVPEGAKDMMMLLIKAMKKIKKGNPVKTKDLSIKRPKQSIRNM